MTILNGNLTLEELYASANEMCQQHWSVTFTGSIELTGRKWTRMYGQFRYWKNEPERTLIRLSTKMNETRTREAVLSTLLHELVHWRLYTTGKPCSDVTEPFIEECLRVGAPISEASNAQSAYRRYMHAKALEEGRERRHAEKAG